MNYDIEQQRLRADKLVTGWLWAHVMLVGLLCMLQGISLIALGAPALAAAILPTILLQAPRGKLAGRIVAAVALMIQISLGVAALQDHPWQVDLHMYYFAMLAVLMSYMDWRIIASGTVAVAVHHLGLNFLFAAAIYPGGADFGRVLMHAVILLVEAAVLMAVSHIVSRLIGSVGEALHKAQRADAESRRAQADGAKLIQVLTEGLSRLARKDLSYRIDDNLPAAFKDVGKNFNEAIHQLENVLGTVAQSSNTITSGTGEISAASADLSRRTEAQAANLEETSAALAEITRKVKETASGAKEAREAVERAQTEANLGTEVVSKAVDAIKRIEGMSHQITRIIDVIEEISFQTNLLALNAGVEAARAGDTGRGFAVVASEVRSLAQRSSEAAKNIKDLITASTTEVNQGVSMVQATGQALEKIVSRVHEINAKVREIAAAAETQATGLAEVNVAVTQIDQTTQQNAAMVEQAAAATQNLTKQSEILYTLIQEFAIGNNQDQTRRAA